MPKTAEATPKTVLDKIVYAIRKQPQTANGVSRIAISKYLKAELDCDNVSAIKKALKKGVDSDVLVQNGQSFRVKADPVVAPEPEVQVELEEDVEGKGDDKAQAGDSITVKYYGYLENGTMFDSETLFEFTLGNGDVIKGWDQGLIGMKVGGRRRILVPPKLGYGKRGCRPDIPPDTKLRFEVTLKKLKRPTTDS